MQHLWKPRLKDALTWDRAFRTDPMLPRRENITPWRVWVNCLQMLPSYQYGHCTVYPAHWSVIHFSTSIQTRSITTIPFIMTNGTLPTSHLYLTHFYLDCSFLFLLAAILHNYMTYLYFPPPGISYILFETRIGCLEKQIPIETKKFIDAIGYMFRNSVFVTFLPKWTRNTLPFFNRYLQGWDTIFGFGTWVIGIWE